MTNSAGFFCCAGHFSQEYLLHFKEKSKNGAALREKTRCLGMLTIFR